MSTTPAQTGYAPQPAPTELGPAEIGVGMRLSVHPHTDRFVEVILGALDDVDAAGLTEGLTIETDDVSTYVGATVAPGEQRLASYLAALVMAASRRSAGGHVVAHVLLSRGCPGEASCDLTTTRLPGAAPVVLVPGELPAVAQWSLYPLLDGDGGAGAHMSHIEEAIATARRDGVAVAPRHYATRLAGDLSQVVATAVDAWARVGATVPHVVTHLTLSVGSPTPVQEER